MSGIRYASGRNRLIGFGQKLTSIAALDPARWIEPDAAQFRERVRDALTTEAWVCEGNYARRTFDLRLPSADLIIWLDTPRLTCFTRVLIRSAMKRPRADRPGGRVVHDRARLPRVDDPPFDGDGRHRDDADHD